MDEDKTKDKILTTAKKRFAAASSALSDQRNEMNDDLAFSILLEQWPAEVKREREGDPNGARPCLTIDKTNQYVRQIVNNIRQNRPGIKVRGVNDDADDDVAQVMQGLLRHIEDASRADQAYEYAAEVAIRGGLGFFRIVTEYASDLTFDQDIVIKRVFDVNSVTLDHNSIEPDGSDARWGFVTESMELEDFKEAYPDADTIDFAADTDVAWFGESKVVVAEYFWLEAKQVKIMFLADGSVIDGDVYQAKVDAGEQMPPVMRERMQSKNVCMWAKINGKQVLESREFPASEIPIFPVVGNEGCVKGKRILSGVVRSAKDSQRLYNYTRSAFTEAVALAPKAPYIAAAGQVDEYSEWDTANTVNHAVLRYDPISVGGNLVGAPQRQGFAGVPSGLAQDMEICERDIQSTMGMHEASKGESKYDQSGIAIQSLQAKGDTNTYHFPDNLGRTVQRAARMIVRMIPKIYDTQRVIRIIGIDGETDHAKLDPEQESAVQEQREDDGSISQIYNLGVGDYDVTVTVGPSYATKRMEAAAMMTELFSRDPSLMQTAGDLYFKALDMPGAEEIAERLKKMLPPQLQDKPKGQPELPPEVTQQMQQMQQALQQSEEHMQILEDQIKQHEFEKQAKVVESQAKIEEARISAAAEAGRAMADIEIAKVNAVDPGRLDKAEQVLAVMMNKLADMGITAASSLEPDPTAGQAGAQATEESVNE